MRLFLLFLFGAARLFSLAQPNITANVLPVIQRGPYLQMGTPNSVIVKWKTDVSCDSKVSFGLSASSLTSQAVNTVVTTDHEVKVVGLSASTKYYYTIGTTTGTLLASSSQQFFKTSPITGSNGEYKFWVVGDVGTGDANQAAAKTGFLNYTGNSHIDGWLWLGDNAYDGGFDNEYQSGIFSATAFATELKRIIVWPAPGNHDYNNNIPFSPAPAYLNIFTLPTSAEAGGIASGTEKYYSYNYGNIHFVVLDSYSVPRGSADPMATWLQNDLAANNLPWTIAYFHHPPYTKGSHNSDNSNFLDGELPEIRQNIIPILESNGVDLVLNGHSHSYERSFLVDGHYGSSGQLSPSMIKDNTSGYYPSSCPYQKYTLINKANKGTVYCVVGCSGKTGSTSSGWPHPVMYSYNNTLLGSLLLEINANRLDAKFITSGSSVYDGFSIVKNAGKKTTLSVCQGQNITLKPSWPATVQWFPLGTSQDSAIVNPAFSTVYYAYDAMSCIKDTFVVNVTPANMPPCNVTAINKYHWEPAVNVFPTFLSNKSQVISINAMPGDILSGVKLYDINAKSIVARINYRSENEVEVQFNEEPANGIYFISFTINSQTINRKILINN